MNPQAGLKLNLHFSKQTYAFYRKARGVYWNYSSTVIVKPINVKKENSKQKLSSKTLEVCERF